VTPPDSEYASSGPRLKAIWQVSEDGARQFQFRWRDTQLDIECSFLTASDGVVRCLPDAIASGDSFLDASCTQRLFTRTAPADACTPPTASVASHIEPSCGESRHRLFSVAAIAAPPMMYKPDGDGGCNGYTASPDTLYFAAQAELSPAMYAAVSLQTDP
jgi:hypothetical protein